MRLKYLAHDFLAAVMFVTAAIWARVVLFGNSLVQTAVDCGQLRSNLSQTYPDVNSFIAAIPAVGSGQMEVIKWSLYDSLVYPHAGLTIANFFQNPIGQGSSAQPGNAGNPKVLGDTNMQQGGALPSPQMFFVQSVEVDFDPGSSVATTTTYAELDPYTIVAADSTSTMVGVTDKYKVLNSGALTFQIMSKPYLNESPLKRFPPKARWELDAAIGDSDTTTHGAEGIGLLRAGGRPYILTPGVTLGPTQNFLVTLQWPALVPTVTNNGRLRVILDGWLARAIQ